MDHERLDKIILLIAIIVAMLSVGVFLLTLRISYHEASQPPTGWEKIQMIAEDYLDKQEAEE